MSLPLSRVLLLQVNPLHPNISTHIFHTVLCTIPKALTRRICLTIRSFFISLILVTSMFDSGVILEGEIRSWSLLGFKGLKFLCYTSISVPNKTIKTLFKMAVVESEHLYRLLGQQPYLISMYESIRNFHYTVCTFYLTLLQTTV